jgi:hypothetical protein
MIEVSTVQYEAGDIQVVVRLERHRESGKAHPYLVEFYDGKTSEIDRCHTNI